ncbi:MAG: hypothetical protein ACPGO3_09400 [Magnetospiraceae bacterium]
MKRPSFFEGVGVAVAASLIGGILYTVLPAQLPLLGSMFRLLVAALAGGHLVYLLRRADSRVGRVATGLIWTLGAGVLWLWHPPLGLFLALHAGAIWLVRTLFFHSGFFTTLADLTLTGFSLAAAIWAVDQTGSLFAGFWCFFLVQALFVFLPVKSAKPGPQILDDPFERAHKAAETALRGLTASR